MILITDAEAYVARLIFKNRIYQHNGQAFEDFFINIMCKADPALQPVKAYGNIGDQKNDGFNQVTGTYYQVFAPENVEKPPTISNGVKKLEEDFAGLYTHWNPICPIKKFYFVINDKYHGIPPLIIQKAIDLDKSPKYDVSVNVFSSKDLEAVFDQLSDTQKYDIVGFLPSEEMPVLDYSALQETITYLLGAESPLDFPDSYVVPDFDQKLAFNGLSEKASSFLKSGSYQDGLLQTYFNENPGMSAQLQKIFHNLYEQAKASVDEAQENFPDIRFFYILNQSCVKNAVPIQACVLALMAHYFSSCDIFEEPK